MLFLTYRRKFGQRKYLMICGQLKIFMKYCGGCLSISSNI